MNNLSGMSFKQSLTGVSFNKSKAYADGVESLVELRKLDSSEVQKAGVLYADFLETADFVKKSDQSAEDRDLRQGQVGLLRATQPLSKPDKHFIAHLRAVDALSKPDGSMTIEAGKSFYRNQPAWPARTFKVSEQGVVFMKEGTFVAQYDPAQKVLSWD